MGGSPNRAITVTGTASYRKMVALLVVLIIALILSLNYSNKITNTIVGEQIATSENKYAAIFLNEKSYDLEKLDRVGSLRRKWSKTPSTGLSNHRKFFLDCGANTGSTYKLFHEIYPNAEDYYMISFEIDPILKPYYASFQNHTAMVPMGVADHNGTMDAHLEPPWNPDSLVARKQAASKWGGGSLFTFGGQKEWRGLQRAVTVPLFDLSEFIRKNFKLEDEIILKIDIEGAEYNVIKKMLDEGTFKYVDKFYLEFHDWQPTGWTGSQKDALRARMKLENVVYAKWEAEYPTVPEATIWQPRVFDENLRKPTTCESVNGQVKLAIAIGMNARRARRLVGTVLAHTVSKSINIGLFVYRDFVYDHPDLIQEWLEDPRLVLGIRGDSPKPHDYFMRYNYESETNMMLISSMRQLLKDTGFNTDYFLADYEGNKVLDKCLSKNKLKKVQHTVWVPPRQASKLDEPFFSRRSVEKIPPVLKSTYLELESMMKAGSQTYPTIVLDSDFDETWISSVFLLDYFASEHAAKHNKMLTNFHSC